MDFSRRLRLFLIGVVLGSVFMYFYVLKDKNIYKSPKEVIQMKLAHLPLQLSSKANCQVNCNAIDTAALRKLWLETEIILGESVVNEKPCPRYHINMPESYKVSKTVECSVCDEFIVLQQFKDLKDTCGCK